MNRDLIAKLRERVEKAKREETELDAHLGRTPAERLRRRGSLAVTVRWDEMETLLEACVGCEPIVEAEAKMLRFAALVLDAARLHANPPIWRAAISAGLVEDCAPVRYAPGVEAAIKEHSK